MEQTWDQWKQTLAKAVQQGETMGMGKDDMVNRAEQIGDVLAQQVDPSNPQQRLLQELWSSADENEQKALASTIIKLVQQ